MQELKPKIIVEVNTPTGYMQVLEYTLQDYSNLHVINWHFNCIQENELPKVNNISFYRDKTSALTYAEEIGTKLLKCI